DSTAFTRRDPSRRRGPLRGSLVPRATSVRLTLPEPHHPALRVGEQRERAQVGHLLLVDEDLAAGVRDALAVRREVVDVDVYRHVAGPRPLALRPHDTAVDA